jgi:hypothetical protein
MVTLHKRDIFEAIKVSLLEDNNLNYSKLYEKVNEKLKLSRDKPKVKLSTRDFGSEINILLNEGLLIRRPDDKSKNKIKPVYFSLTKKAIKQHQFDVLGISPEKENRRKLYHLLFFYQAFSPMRHISKKKLDEILSSIPATEKDLVIERHFHTAGTNATETIYKPVKYIQIQKTELSDVGPSKRETAVLYFCRFLSFSEEEIKEYLEKSNNDILVPFVNSIDFKKEEIENQFRKAFDNLRDARLISLIKDTFFGKTRFIISEESLRDLINKIWIIHGYQLDILRSKMNYVEAPDEIEKQWLERIFGKEQTDRIISDAKLKRLSIGREEEKVKEVLDNIENDTKFVEAFKLHVTKKYEKVIKEYDFPIDLIEGVCLGKVFH